MPLPPPPSPSLSITETPARAIERVNRRGIASATVPHDMASEGTTTGRTHTVHLPGQQHQHQQYHQQPTHRPEQQTTQPAFASERVVMRDEHQKNGDDSSPVEMLWFGDEDIFIPMNQVVCASSSCTDSDMIVVHFATPGQVLNMKRKGRKWSDFVHRQIK
jgi:hypothetical protein